MISELQKRKLFQVLDLLAEIGRMHLADPASQAQNSNEAVGELDEEANMSNEEILIAEE